ncbi:hypothetical protein ACES2L_14800 [Bdellovibrio bacteriovorus]
MRFFSFLLAFSFAALALAEELPPARVIVNPVVGSSARTLPQWQFGFQRTAGANINSHLLANALTVGVLPRLEFGVVPIYYIGVPGSSNYSAKVHFYKGDDFDAAASVSEARFLTRIEYQGRIETPALVLQSTHLSVNYRPPRFSDLTISPFTTTVCAHVDSANAMIFIGSLKCEVERGVDLQWQIKDREWITFAVGNLRDTGLSPYEELHTGVGAAWSKFRPKELISRPSVGVYYTPETSNTLYLLSTTFYEI